MMMLLQEEVLLLYGLLHATVEIDTGVCERLVTEYGPILIAFTALYVYVQVVRFFFHEMRIDYIVVQVQVNRHDRLALALCNMIHDRDLN